MKLQPNVPQPSLEDPYKGDLFGRQVFGDRLTKIISSVEDHGVICLDSNWGEGKSTFIKMWIESLKGNKINVIYYDSFEGDWSQDIFSSFLGEISGQLQSLKNQEAPLKEAIKEFSKKCYSVGKIVLKSTLNMGLRAVTGGLIDSSGFNLDKDHIAKTSEQALEKALEKESSDFQRRKEGLTAFKSSLSKVASLVRKNQNFPLLIIVDELDRTRPNHAVAILEIAKHLFDVTNVAFLLVTNIEQLQKYISAEFGASVDSNTYLQKFIGLTIRLPDKGMIRGESGFLTYIKTLIGYHNLNFSNEFVSIFSDIATHFILSLREMERITIHFSIYKESKNSKQSFPEIIFLLIVIKIKFPDSFVKIERGEFSYDNFINVLSLKKLFGKTSYSGYGNYLEKLIKMHFLTDDEIANDSMKDDILKMKNSLGFQERSSIIPNYCIDLNILPL